MLDNRTVKVRAESFRAIRLLHPGIFARKPFEESGLALYGFAFVFLILLEISAKLRTKLQDHYRRKEPGLGKFVVRRNVCLIQESNVTGDVDFDFELSSSRQQKSRDLMLAVEKLQTISNYPTYGRLKHGVSLEVAI
jgi:hypothetical protein